MRTLQHLLPAVICTSVQEHSEFSASTQLDMESQTCLLFSRVIRHLTLPSREKVGRDFSENMMECLGGVEVVGWTGGRGCLAYAVLASIGHGT